jgi:hypothetical protein
MKKFDLEKALSGESVITYTGCPVIGLKFTRGFLFGIVNGEIESFFEDGRHSAFPNDPLNLCMQESLLYISIFKKCNKFLTFSYNTPDRVKDHIKILAGKGVIHLKTLEVEL